LRKAPDVLAIVILVATKFRQSQVVFLENSDPQVPELSGVHIDQSLFVPLGNISDRHDIDVNPMLLGERAALATDS
jgi:hypothetical protein